MEFPHKTMMSLCMNVTKCFVCAAVRLCVIVMSASVSVFDCDAAGF